VTGFGKGHHLKLIDGSGYIFRAYHALPPLTRRSDGAPIGAVAGFCNMVWKMVEEAKGDDAPTHVAVIFDHSARTFRNDLYAGYKDGSDLDPVILGQFGLLEDALEAAGFCVFAMVEYEADDALGAAARVAAADDRVDQVMICTADKDLGQCVTDDARIVQFDRRKGQVIDRAGVIEKFGVPPESIPDYLGLVGDSADGFPGLPGWGAKSAAAVLARYGHIEDIPASPGQWDVPVRGAAKLAKTLQDHMDEALLFRRIATIDYDAPTIGSIDELQWRGPGSDFTAIAADLDAPKLAERATRLAAARGW
jgi:5'-3' exonuclease